MNDRTIHHATFTIERVYPFPVERVFAAWSRPESKASWFAASGTWKSTDHELDFEVGGRERLVSSPPDGGAPHVFECRYHSIVENEHIVYAYDMIIDHRLGSVSLATVEFAGEGKTTRMKFTEQGIFLGGWDGAADREHGTHRLLDQLGAALDRQGTTG